MKNQTLTIAVTGATGLIGWHLRCALASQADISVKAGGRDVFRNDAALVEFVRDADVVVHLAGVNRGDAGEVEQGNIDLAQRLASALSEARVVPALIYASSIHIERQTEYGRSKRRAGVILEAWARRANARFVNLILPHVFGEHGKPFYNSVVATFCDQIARGDTPQVIEDSELSLLHAQDVADIVIRLAHSPTGGDVRANGCGMQVSELLIALQRIATSYGNGVVPPLDRPIEVALFNTYRACLFPETYPVRVSVRTDSRGALFEAVKSASGGQVFISSTAVGVTRGNHYHRRKIERFFVLKGNAEIRIRRLFHDAVVSYVVAGDQPQFVDIPTLHTHNISNIGEDDMVTLFWANEIFDPENPDTEPQRV